MSQIRPLELLLIELIFYTGLWLWDDFIATLLSVSFTAITIFIFLISLISEWIEPSRVPKWYYWVMFISIVAPIIAALFFVGMMDAKLEWLEGNIF